jgi:hypothetical protein
MVQADTAAPADELNLDSIVAEALRPWFEERAGPLQGRRKEALSAISPLAHGAANGADHCIPLFRSRVPADVPARDHAAT